MGKRWQEKSRRKTPWDGSSEMTATQEFLQKTYQEHYQQRHPALRETGEAVMINTFIPGQCPICGELQFKKDGIDHNGIQRYKCMKGHKFRPTTGTIFDSRKISVSEWIEYCLNVFRYVSLNAGSWNNKNALSTSKYWLNKLLLTLEGYQEDIVLSGKVYLDETYYTVRMRDTIVHEDGSKLRGISGNQICIGVATDKKHTVCLLEGYGRPTMQKSYETFKSHIASGSTLIHDKEKTHRLLLETLDLKNVSYAADQLKGVADQDNPLDPVNRRHYLLKKFLNAHSGFNRDDLQGYLNLFAFVMNPPKSPLEKVDIILNLAFNSPKSLRYRDQFKSF